MRTKLRLGHTGTHGRRRRDTSRRHIDHLIDEFGTGPLLVRQELHLLFALLALNLFDVGDHAAVSKGARQLGDDESVAVETGQRDELPDVAQATEVVVETGNLLVGHARSVPVEGRTEIVGQHLVRVHLSHAVAKELGIGNSGNLGLHPNEIRVGSVRPSPLDAVLDAGTELVVALANAALFPIKVDLLLGQNGEKSKLKR